MREVSLSHSIPLRKLARLSELRGGFGVEGRKKATFDKKRISVI